jgi:hypothetical protein
MAIPHLSRAVFGGPAGTFEARERCPALQDFSFHMRIMTTKRQRAEFIETRSREMAESGKYSDFMEIEFELCRQGFPEARGLLDPKSAIRFLFTQTLRAGGGIFGPFCVSERAQPVRYALRRRFRSHHGTFWPRLHRPHQQVGASEGENAALTTFLLCPEDVKSVMLCKRWRWPSEIVLQEMVSNYPVLLQPKAAVVNDMGKGAALTASSMIERDERK